MRAVFGYARGWASAPGGVFPAVAPIAYWGE
jgi:hypothetical protein